MNFPNLVSPVVTRQRTLLTLAILFLALFGCRSSDVILEETVSNSDDPQNQQQDPDDQQQAMGAQDLDGAIGSVTWATEPNKVLIRWFGRANVP